MRRKPLLFFLNSEGGDKITFNNKCKICRSSRTDELDFCRLYLQLSYKVLIDLYASDLDNLNFYNLSNHINNHVDKTKIKFWQNLRESEGIYKPTVEEQNALLVKMRSFSKNSQQSD